METYNFRGMLTGLSPNIMFSVYEHTLMTGDNYIKKNYSYRINDNGDYVFYEHQLYEINKYNNAIKKYAKDYVVSKEDIIQLKYHIGKAILDFKEQCNK